MVFKLVRTDTESPHKIVLSCGIQAFGRGVFLDCEDKRVSRNHGQLNVTEDSVILLSLHHNPCFYKKQGSDDTQVLTQDNSVELDNGDKFGLLVDKYWYELLSIKSEINENVTVAMPKVTNYQNDTQETNLQTEETSVQLPVSVKEEEFDGNDSELLDFDLNETAQDASRAESPSMIPAANGDSNETQPQQCSPPSSPAKVKTEPDDLNQTDDGAGTSNAKADSPSPSSPPPVRATSPAPAQAPAAPSQRERCWYGAQCYRKNIRHKAEFSHPGDGDWISGRRLCPHGASCWKDDPRHLRDYEHPPKPAKKRRPRRKSVASDEGKSSREVSPLPDSPLPAKRRRKTITRPSLDGSGSDEDPYKTDESDEWEPPSNLPSTDDMSQSQSQSQAY